LHWRVINEHISSWLFRHINLLLEAYSELGVQTTRWIRSLVSVLLI
jgi:hypothetical protein